MLNVSRCVWTAEWEKESSIRGQKVVVFLFFFVDLFSLFPFFVFVTVHCCSLFGVFPFKATSLRQMVWSAWTWPVILGMAETCRKAQMIPYWASSCSSRWLKASQGQMTVMSAKNKDQDAMLIRPLQVTATDMRCILKTNRILPVPKPSIPGISSPKLQKKKREDD